MKIEIKRLHKNAKATKAHDADAGVDLTATTCEPGQHFVEYGTGVAVNIPKGYVGLLFARSSISKTDMMLANSVGVIDSGYQGEVKVRMRRLYGKQDSYKIGDRICQLVIVPLVDYQFIEVDEFEQTDRGAGAFGSSGK